MRTSVPKSGTPRKRLKGGFELSMNEMFEIFLALLLIAGVAIFFIAGGGMLSGILNQLCTSVPVLCGQTATRQDADMSQASFNALVIAHNCILDPANCPCTKNPQECILEPTKKSASGIFSGKGISGFAIKFAAVTTSNQVRVECGYQSQNTILKSYTIGADAQKAKDACEADCPTRCSAMGQGCQNPSCIWLIGGSYNCVAEVKVNVQTTEDIKPVYARDQASAEALCKSTYCSEGNKYCEIAANGERYDYGFVREDNTMLECKCEASGIQPFSVYGFDRSFAQLVCSQKTSKPVSEISLYGCTQVPGDKNSAEYNNLLALTAIVPNKNLFSSATRYKCTFLNANSPESNVETYYAYGIGTEQQAQVQAKQVCDNDIKVSASTKTQLVLSNIEKDSQVTGNLLFVGIFSPDILYSRTNPLDGYNCKISESSQVTNIPQSCKVINFNTPDNFMGFSGEAKEYISGFGDPNFLIYFQKFPQGEDSSWKSWSTWYEGIGTFMFISMCFGSLAKPVWKLINLARPTKFAQAVSKFPALKTEIGNEWKYVKNTFAKSKIITTETVSVVKRDVTLDAGSQYFQKIYLVPTEPTTTTVTATAFSTAELASVLKADFKDWFLQNYKPAAAQFVGYVGIDAALSYGAARFDSEIGKFVYDNPGSLVLGMPLKAQQPVKLSKIDYDNLGGVMSKIGKPIILDKGSNGVVSLALASPCHADLTVKDSKIECGFYSYNKLTNEVQCLEPKIITQPGTDDLKCGDFSGFKQGSGFFGTTHWLNQKYFYSIEGMITDKTISSFSGSRLQTLRLPSKGSASLLNIERTSCPKLGNLICYRADLSDSSQIQSTLGIRIVCGSSYSDIATGTLDYKKAKFVNIVESWFKNNANSDYSQFCIVYNDLASDQEKAYENYKQSQGIAEIVWIKDKLYGDEWKLVDGYNTGKGDVYYDNGKGDPPYYPQIYEMAVFSPEGDRASLAFFKDGSMDGKWDALALFIGEVIDNTLRSNAKAFMFDDQDVNGEIDGILYWNCWVDGVVTSVNPAPYKEIDKGKPNYCYRTSSWTKGIAIVTMSFAIDALAKRSPHPAVWLAGAAANCGLAAYDLYSKKNWPEGGVGG